MDKQFGTGSLREALYSIFGGAAGATPNTPTRPQEAASSRMHDWHSMQDQCDSLLLRGHSGQVVEGFLNLGKADGWNEGSSVQLGATFVRYTLRKFCHEHKGELFHHLVPVQAALKAFATVQGCDFDRETPRQILPTSSRVCYDANITGWEGHAVIRIIGNLASTYRPTAPFFEVLINSAKTPGEEACNPFFVTLYANQSDLASRTNNLRCMASVPAGVATHTFYATYLQHPARFARDNAAQLGPNSQRILKALEYLETVSINAQVVGNCWMKQPERGMLVSLYLEVVGVSEGSTPEEAWKEAVGLYKMWQKATLPFIEELLANCKTTTEMQRSARTAIERRQSF